MSPQIKRQSPTAELWLIISKVCLNLTSVLLWFIFDAQVKELLLVLTKGRTDFTVIDLARMLLRDADK
jgi:hypothetical protein